MKTIANRMIVIAASVLALGTVAFGQTRLTAEIPFEFKTATGTLPAGTYEFLPQANSASHSVLIRNTTTWKAFYAGNPVHDIYSKAADKPVVEFVCGRGSCTLTAIRTSSGALR